MFIRDALVASARRIAAPLRRRAFAGSASYWERRYRAGGSSGDGSYGQLAEFKARFLNGLVANEAVSSVIEFGCGDGHQLTLAQYPRYLGLDVSPAAIERCTALFAGDRTKSFLAYKPDRFHDPAGFVRADMAMSLDVIFHLVEDEVFGRYMGQLFEAATRYVVIYSSNIDRLSTRPHERHRRFTDWITANRPDWTLVRTEKNELPFDATTGLGSMSDFYVFAPATSPT